MNNLYFIAAGRRIKNLNSWIPIVCAADEGLCITIMNVVLGHGEKIASTHKYTLSGIDQLVSSLRENNVDRKVANWLVTYQYRAISYNKNNSSLEISIGKRVQDVTELLYALILANNKKLFHKLINDVISDESRYPPSMLVDTYINCSMNVPNNLWDIKKLRGHIVGCMRSDYIDYAPQNKR